MKQTAVEWLQEALMTSENAPNYNQWAFNKAKEMEKEQIENAWQNGIENCGEFNNPTIVSGEHYYNETFNK